MAGAISEAASTTSLCVRGASPSSSQKTSSNNMWNPAYGRASKLAKGAIVDAIGWQQRHRRTNVAAS